MTDDLDSLRPHPNTGDEAPVSYRAKHIRRLFAEIERLKAENERLEDDLFDCQQERRGLETSMGEFGI